MFSRHAIGFAPTRFDSRVPRAPAPVPSSARHHTTRGPRVPMTRRRSVDQSIMATLVVTQMTQKLVDGDV